MTHILIISAPFYKDINSLLLQGAIERLNQQGISHELVEVPGAFEIPAAIGFALHKRLYDGFIALGCVIRGETTHYDYVCQESARGLNQLAVEHKAAIGYGILTVENMEQAVKRADPKQGNKGSDAAEACLCMIDLKRRFEVSA